MTAVDLFAGAGGATQGLRDAGFDVVAAVELDADAAGTWAMNHPGVVLQADVRTVTPEALMNAGGFGYGKLDLLKACPPCQGFSSLRGGGDVDEARNDLVLDTLRLVDGLLPRAVLIENVPGLRRDARFAKLTDGLRDRGFALRDYIVEATSLGVPQRRRRLVVIATRDGAAPGDLEEVMPSSGRRPPMTAGEALDALARSLSPETPDRWRTPTGIVAERIAAIPVNGNRFDLPARLQLDCHKNLAAANRRNATGSYGRVRRNDPAPTMTTRCTTPACGSFIHPTENRGLSLREAAALQTFPVDYLWLGSYGSVERQIGNAVPVWMAEELGRAVIALLGETADDCNTRVSGAALP